MSAKEFSGSGSGVGQLSGGYTGAMFLIFGIDTKQRDLGRGVTRTCPRCRNTTQWARIRTFKQFTLFFVIPAWRWGRQRLEVCGICGHSVQV